MRTLRVVASLVALIFVFSLAGCAKSNQSSESAPSESPSVAVAASPAASGLAAPSEVPSATSSETPAAAAGLSRGDLITTLLNVRKTRNPSDVDEHRWGGKSQLHQWQERMAASNQLGLVAVLDKHGDRFFR